MLRRFAPALWLALLTGLAITTPFAPLARGADPKTEEQFDKWAKSINAQNPAIGIDARSNYAIGGYARSAYQRTLPKPASYSALMISPRIGGTAHPLEFSFPKAWKDTVTDRQWKGVVVGRDPEPVGRGEVEPIGLPRFEYELKPEVKGEPRRVVLKFWTAKDVDDKRPSWEFEVSAGVVTPMTAAALDGRLGLFTLTAADEDGREVGAAVHPALQGHRLAYRPALLDLFAELDEVALLKILPADERNALLKLALADPSLTAADKAKMRAKLKQPLRLADETVKDLFEQKVSKEKDSSHTLSAVVEKPWRLEADGLKAVAAGNDPGKAHVRFVHRIVYEAGKGKYEELPVSDQVTKEVFASLTDAEKRLVQEYNEAVVVHRIIYRVKQGKIVNFDRDHNWSKLIDDLGDIYKANLDKGIDAAELEKATATWADEYNGKDREMPEKMKLK